MKDRLVNFIVRQRWRIAQTYTLIVPIIGILNTFLYFLIALGVFEVDLSYKGVILGFLGILSIFLATGYGLDKLGYFRKDLQKSFSSQIKDVYLIQADWNALLTARYMKKSEEELVELIENHQIHRVLND